MREESAAVLYCVSREMVKSGRSAISDSGERPTEVSEMTNAPFSFAIFAERTMSLELPE